jgi:broad-specificity NMP kinase
MMARMLVLLTGLPGTGKSTIADALASELEYQIGYYEAFAGDALVLDAVSPVADNCAARRCLRARPGTTRRGRPGGRPATV